MHMQIILVVFAKCSVLFCLTTAAPVGGMEPGEASTQRKVKVAFTTQEKKFIHKEVSAQAQTTEITSWTSIAKEHERKVNNKELGFDRMRSAATIRKHFDRFLKKEIPAWKPKLQSHPHKRYTEQEEEFINKELSRNSSWPKYLYSGDTWQDILDKHNIKRQQKCEGFLHERTLAGLRSHFKVSMRSRQRVSKEVMGLFRKNFRTDQEGTSNKNLDEDIHSDHATDPSTNRPTVQETLNDDDEVYGNIMKDLDDLQNSVDEDGIDPSLFVDPKKPSAGEFSLD